MKPIHLDLVPDRRWLWCWSNCLICVGLIVGAAAWPVWKLYRQQVEMVAALGRTEQALRELKKPPVVVNDPRHASASRAARLLQVDLNPMFTTIEAVQQPSTKLLSVGLDLGMGSARVEYAAESLGAVAEITGRLNDGYEWRPWRLESVNAAAANSLGQAGRAVWAVRINELK